MVGAGQPAGNNMYDSIGYHFFITAPEVVWAFTFIFFCLTDISVFTRGYMPSLSLPLTKVHVLLSCPQHGTSRAAHLGQIVL